MSTLKDKTINGIGWSALERFGTLGISFLANVVLARLLSPDDFGTIGLLAIFILLSNTFIDGGFGAALIQKKDTTNRDYSTIFYWNIVLAILLYAILYFSSPLIASFFHTPILKKVLRVQALILITNSLGVVHVSIIRKELKFKLLTYAYFFPMLISAIVAILLAYKGWGIWSLVALQLINSLLQVVFLWALNTWRPSFEFDFKSFKGLFSYGSFLLLSNLINTFCDNFQGLLIGRKFNSSLMGYYSQAKKLEEVPTLTLTTITSQVTFPVFSKINGDKESLFSAHKKSLRLLNLVNTPLMVLLYVIANQLFILLYSEKWIVSIPYFQILCIGGLANCLQSVNYSVYIASGRSRQMFRWNIIKRMIGILLMIIGVNWGIEGVLYGMVVSYWITYIINALLANKVTGYTLLLQLKDFLPVLVAAIIAAVVTLAVEPLLPRSLLLLAIMKLFIFIILYFLLCYLMKLESLELFIEVIQPYLGKLKKSE